MPTINRQAPPQKAAQFSNRSILATAVPVTSLSEKWVKVCFYGRNGSGKTTIASMFPKPSLFISCEPAHCGGVQSVTNIDGITLIRVAPKNKPRDKNDPPYIVYGSDKIVQMASELATSNHYKTVILKTATSLQDVLLVELMDLSKVPELMSWGMVPDGVYQSRAEKLRETIRPLIDLINCHVVILAQEKDHNASEDRKTSIKSKLLGTMQQGSFMAPSLGATNAEWLQTACGYVFQVYEDEVTQEIVVPQIDMYGKPAPPSIQLVGTGKRQRHIRLAYHPNFAARGKWEYDKNRPEFVTASDPQGLYNVVAKYLPALK